nr:Ycf62 [Erythrotrichia foliiformis]
MKTNKSVIHEKFNHFVENNNIFKTNKSILAAISGGQDSICLLKLLRDYQLTQAITVHIVHFNHGWRLDSDNNADFIKKIAYRWGLIFHNERADTILSEEEARTWRYSKMLEICLNFHIQYIVTGHTLNDKLETIFFNMMKGTGFDGIQAIQPIVSIHQTVEIIHPLLDIKREETLWFCRKFSLPVWSDFTNYNREIQRNRIREEFIPYCRQYFNMNIEASLHKFINNSNYDLDYLQERTYYLYYKYKHPKYVGINKTNLLFIPIALRKRVIRAFVYHNTHIRLNFVETKEYLSLINSHKIQIKQLSSSWYVCVSSKWIYLLSNKTTETTQCL